MSEELSIETERADDLPVLLAQLDKMQVARLLDQHFPSHGNWQGVSVGTSCTVWLGHILSQANHRQSCATMGGKPPGDLAQLCGGASESIGLE